jgi:prepilin-type N-terminal cleavage/methylation domain-containing protein
MKTLFISLLNIQFKYSKNLQKNSGFTLLELLVAMILAALVITPLLGFMINVLDTDRREQAKATTEQEIQAALEYISRDLQQAVYIYDDDGVTRNSNTDVNLSGIQDQIPPVKGAPSCKVVSGSSNCKPILVFWKREYIPESVGVNSTNDTQKDDGFAYSLVGYYFITNPNATVPWSSAARIGRFQIRGKVNAEYSNTKGEACDSGFNPPPLDLTISGSKLKEKMSQWKTSLGVSTSPTPPCSSPSTEYTKQVDTLVDYISTSGPNPTTSPCPTDSRLVGTVNSGFFACVNADEVLAQVHIRGNALVRLTNKDTVYSPEASAYFPGGSIRVQGRGFLFTK